ncbi:hypothetical protein Bca4012_025792 [Brassica carinata]
MAIPGAACGKQDEGCTPLAGRGRTSCSLPMSRPFPSICWFLIGRSSSDSKGKFARRRDQICNISKITIGDLVLLQLDPDSDEQHDGDELTTPDEVGTGTARRRRAPMVGIDDWRFDSGGFRGGDARDLEMSGAWF